ncbi:hypothetical protein WJX77_010866 [Trebouxia sp. C0004]
METNGHARQAIEAKRRVLEGLQKKCTAAQAKLEGEYGQNQRAGKRAQGGDSAGDAGQCQLQAADNGGSGFKSCWHTYRRGDQAPERQDCQVDRSLGWGHGGMHAAEQRKERESLEERIPSIQLESELTS